MLIYGQIQFQPLKMRLIFVHFFTLTESSVAPELAKLSNDIPMEWNPCSTTRQSSVVGLHTWIWGSRPSSAVATLSPDGCMAKLSISLRCPYETIILFCTSLDTLCVPGNIFVYEFFCGIQRRTLQQHIRYHQTPYSEDYFLCHVTDIHEPILSPNLLEAQKSGLLSPTMSMASWMKFSAWP